MKIQAVHGKAGEMKRLVVEKFDLAYAGDAQDGLIGKNGHQVHPDAGGRIQRNAATARIQYEIEGIRIIAQPCLQKNNPAGKQREGETCNQPGRRRHELFLGL